MNRIVLALCLVISSLVAQPPARPRGAGGPPGLFSSMEVVNYPLSMDKINKWSAANHNMIAYTKAHPEIQQKAKDINLANAKTLDDFVAMAKARAPEYVNVIESSGIGFKEYFMITGSLMTAWIAEETEAHGATRGPVVNQANVDFVKANREKLQAMFNDYAQMGKGAGK